MTTQERRILLLTDLEAVKRILEEKHKNFIKEFGDTEDAAKIKQAIELIGEVVN